MSTTQRSSRAIKIRSVNGQAAGRLSVGVSYDSAERESLERSLVMTTEPGPKSANGRERQLCATTVSPR